MSGQSENFYGLSTFSQFIILATFSLITEKAAFNIPLVIPSSVPFYMYTHTNYIL